MFFMPVYWTGNGVLSHKRDSCGHACEKQVLPSGILYINILLNNDIEKNAREKGRI